jgi:S1-C subfamily serine protease
VNAALSLLRRAGRGIVRIESAIPNEHPSVQILGAARLGSGTIIDPDGLILTVNYVALGATSITVTLADEREVSAEIAAIDLRSGLAVLRVVAPQLPALVATGSDHLALGDEVCVVSSHADGGCRVSDGGVTYLGPFDANWEYTLDRAIMCSALNPGLGGGALIDRMGRVVGVVSLSVNVIGRFILAIPCEYFVDHRDELLHHGRRVSVTPRAWLGVFCHVMQQHVVIAGLMPGAPADRAGLRQGDVILTIDGHDVVDRGTLYRCLWTRRAGDAVALQIFRDNQIQTIKVPTVAVEEFFS